MKNREFGNSGIYTSPVTFGSMRLNPQRLDLDSAVKLITHLYQGGVNTFHSSHEYETDSFFCQVMEEFRRGHPQAEIVHIAKIGVPHFDENQFAGHKLSTLIEARLKALGTERIDIVQWLVRHQPNEDKYRLAILKECQQELNSTWSRLQQEGKVGVLTSFPYSVPFAKEVLTTPSCQGLVTYLNPLELEMVSFLDEMAEAGQGYVAIRPLYAGLITTEQLNQHRATSAEPAASELKIDRQKEKICSLLHALDLSAKDATRFAIQFPLLHPAVSSVMLSVTSLEHAEQAIKAADSAVINQDVFNQAVSCMASLN